MFSETYVFKTISEFNFQDKFIFFTLVKKHFFLFLIFCRSMLRSNVASNAEVQEDARSVNCPTQISCDDAKYSPYRSINGSCNNLNHPNWGTIFSPQPRYQPAQYDDGITCFFFNFILQATHSVLLFLILIFITP